MSCDIDRRLGAKLRTLRQRMGMTAEQLAGAIGELPDRIARYEAGDEQIAVAKLTRFAAALDIDVAEFFEGLVASERPVPRPSTIDLEIVRKLHEIADPAVKMRISAMIDDLIRITRH